MKSKQIGATVATIVIIGGLVFGVSSVKKIKNGHVGVVYSIQGGV